MKRSGILNAALAGHLARLGHTDTLVVADCGLPIPRTVPVVDLALRFGVPGFTTVLDTVLDEVVIESSTAAREALTGAAGAWLMQRRDRLGHLDFLPHEQLKAAVAGAAVVVRTGEATPHANVVLHCGVPF
jgi:D-ribose pyranase